jgi:hypothetical protein
MVNCALKQLGSLMMWRESVGGNTWGKGALVSVGPWKRKRDKEGVTEGRGKMRRQRVAGIWEDRGAGRRGKDRDTQSKVAGMGRGDRKVVLGLELVLGVRGSGSLP